MSAIEWTDETWNPVTGCDRVSPGCAHCYALELAPRLRAMGNAKYQRVRDGDPRTSGPAFGVTLHPDALDQPLRWRKPRRVFVNSMSDLFHEEIPYEFIREVFNVMRRCDGSITAAGERMPSHVFQVLTKRPERMRDLALSRRLGFDPERPPPNIWLGVSIENRRFVHRADLLRETPAAVRFISAEPLLGPLIGNLLTDVELERELEGLPLDAALPILGESFTDYNARQARELGPNLDLAGIDWLIVGGESGTKARHVDPQWVRDLRDACRCDLCGFERAEACDFCSTPLYRSPAFFFKQWGGRTPKAGGRELDGRTWDEMPSVAEGAVA